MIIPLPQYEEPELPPVVKTERNHARIIEYLNCKPWICVHCKLNNFGRNQCCASCRQNGPCLVPPNGPPLPPPNIPPLP